jgi:hypothetical protein
MKSTIEETIDQFSFSSKKNLERMKRFHHIYTNLIMKTPLKFFLIEDEPLALERMKQLLLETDNKIEIVGDAD